MNDRSNTKILINATEPKFFKDTAREFYSGCMYEGYEPKEFIDACLKRHNAWRFVLLNFLIYMALPLIIGSLTDSNADISTVFFVIAVVAVGGGSLFLFNKYSSALKKYVSDLIQCITNTFVRNRVHNIYVYDDAIVIETTVASCYFYIRIKFDEVKRVLHTKERIYIADKHKVICVQKSEIDRDSMIYGITTGWCRRHKIQLPKIFHRFADTNAKNITLGIVMACYSVIIMIVDLIIRDITGLPAEMTAWTYLIYAPIPIFVIIFCLIGSVRGNHYFALYALATLMLVFCIGMGCDGLNMIKRSPANTELIEDTEYIFGIDIPDTKRIASDGYTAENEMGTLILHFDDDDNEAFNKQIRSDDRILQSEILYDRSQRYDYVDVDDGDIGIIYNANEGRFNIPAVNYYKDSYVILVYRYESNTLYIHVHYEQLEAQ